MLGHIIVFSPVNFEVFQRTSKSAGFIEFNGGSKDVTSIKAKISGKDYEDRPVNIDCKIKIDKTGAFNQKVEVPAGGWYKVEITYKTDKFEHTYIAENVGVGEIILAAGQSNSTNCGQYKTYQRTGMVSTTDGVTWRLGDDPQIGTHDLTTGGSLFPALGDALYNEFKVPIGIASTGWGGTNSFEWQPYSIPHRDPDNQTQENLFNFFIKRVLRFGNNGFRCILWHQGESDTNSTSFQYYANICNLIETTRKMARWYIPWFVAIASLCPPNNLLEEVRNGQMELVKQGVAFLGPDTDTLTGDYRDYDGEGIHFSPKGLKKHGEMWAEIIGKFIHNQID